MLDWLKKLAAQLAGRQARKPAAAPRQAPGGPRSQPAAPLDQNISVGGDLDDILEATRRQADAILEESIQNGPAVPEPLGATRYPGDVAGGPEWEAKYPEFAVGDGKILPEGGATDDVRDEEDETPWLVAPATSNILEMKLSDKTRPNATFSAPQRSGRRPVLSPLTIHLRFKPSPYGKSAGLVREYEYYFDDRAAGRAVWDAMKNSPHPWGEVGYPQLVLARVQYQRIR